MSTEFLKVSCSQRLLSRHTVLWSGGAASKIELVLPKLNKLILKLGPRKALSPVT